ncbi:hypothetical protein KAI87_02010 [Myxococcota bacterium]|nr:hypothetical protein [Myxococcota bacterium]
MEITPKITSAQILDVNKNGALDEVQDRRLQKELAALGQQGSQSGVSTDSLDKAISKAITSTNPTIRTAAEKIETSLAKLSESMTQQSDIEKSVALKKKIGGASVVAMFGGPLLALAGLATAGVIVAAAGAFGALATGISGVVGNGPKEIDAAAVTVATARAEHESALADLLAAQRDSRGARSVARGPRQSLPE